MKIPLGGSRIVTWGQTESNGVIFVTFRHEPAERLSNKFVFTKETDGSNLKRHIEQTSEASAMGKHVYTCAIISLLDNVQKTNNCINVPSSQTFRSYVYTWFERGSSINKCAVYL
jgi:hypothetical protein